MSIILKHIWRNIKSNRFRSLLIVFSLALSAAVFYLNLNIGRDVTESTDVLFKGVIKNYDVIVVGDFDEQTLAIPDLVTTLGAELSLGSLTGHDVMLYYGDINRMLTEGLLILDDAPADFDPGTEGWVVMPRAKAAYYGIAPGDVFTVLRDGKPETYTLTACVESAGMFAWANAEVGEVFICRYDVHPTILYVDLAHDADVTAIANRLQTENKDLFVDTLYERTNYDERLNGIRQILSIVLLLVIGIAFFVISSTDALIINYRIPVLGTFRSIGATARKTNGILLLESAAYGLVAGIPGVIFGELIRTVMRTQYLKVSAGAPRPFFLLLVPLFTICMNAVISLFAIIRTGNVPIKALIFRKQTGASKPSVRGGIIGLTLLAASFVTAVFNRNLSFPLLLIELLLAIVGVGMSMGLFCSLFTALTAESIRKRFGGPAWLGVRNLAVNRINRATSLLVTAVLALVIIIYVCISSISTFFAKYQNNYPYDILIKFTTMDREHYSYLETLDGVDSVVYEFWNITACLVNGEEQKVNFVASDGYSNGIDVDETMLNSLTDNQIIVDYLFAKMNHYNLGDTLVVTRAGDSSHFTEPFTATIVGFCDSSIFYSSRTTIIMTHDDFLRYVKINPAIIGISTSRDVYEMIEDINDATIANDDSMFRVSAKQDYVNSEIIEATNALKSVALVPLLTILLALCSLVNNQLISFNQKRMLYAVLYSTAMSRKQLRTMILTELASSFFVGCFVGLALSVWLAKIMRDIIFVSISYVRLTITAGQIGLSLLLLFGLLCTTALFPLDCLKKMEIVKEIKYE